MSHMSVSLPSFSASLNAFFKVFMGASGSAAWRKPNGELKEWSDDPDDVRELPPVVPLKPKSCELVVSSVGEVKLRSENSESWAVSAWVASSWRVWRSSLTCEAEGFKGFPSLSDSTSASRAAKRVESNGGQNSFCRQDHLWKTKSDWQSCTSSV